MSSSNVKNLYHLKIKPSGYGGIPHYDVSVAFVVRALNETEARQFCQQNGGDETRVYHDNGGRDAYSFWTNSEFTDCTFLGTADDQNSDSGVICRDYNAG